MTAWKKNRYFSWCYRIQYWYLLSFRITFSPWLNLPFFILSQRFCSLYAVCCLLAEFSMQVWYRKSTTRTEYYDSFGLYLVFPNLSLYYYLFFSCRGTVRGMLVVGWVHLASLHEHIEKYHLFFSCWGTVRGMLVGGRVLPAAGGPPPRPRLHDPGPQPQSQAAHSGTSSGDLLNKERLPLFYLLF